MLESLPLSWNCRFIGDAPGEKFSGGFYRQRHDPKHGILWSHPYFAFNYLLAGSGVFVDHLGREHEATPGSLMLRFPDRPLCIRHGQGWFEFASAAPKSLHSWLMASKMLDEDVTFLVPGLSTKIIGKAQSFVDSLETFGSPEGSATTCAAYMDLLRGLFELSRGGRGSRSLNTIGERAKLILGADLDKELEMPSVAARLGMGYELFRKKFTSECGVTPKEYRIRRRLEKADGLLLHSDMSVKEIAMRLGYPKDSDFIRQYKKFRKTAPGEFRRSKYA